MSDVIQFPTTARPVPLTETTRRPLLEALRRLLETSFDAQSLDPGAAAEALEAARGLPGVLSRYTLDDEDSAEVLGSLEFAAGRLEWAARKEGDFLAESPGASVLDFACACGAARLVGEVRDRLLGVERWDELDEEIA
jgi:hypothetical protein